MTPKAEGIFPVPFYPLKHRSSSIASVSRTVSDPFSLNPVIPTSAGERDRVLGCCKFNQASLEHTPCVFALLRSLFYQSFWPVPAVVTRSPD